MMTGISAVQGVLTYIFLLFPAGITFLLLMNLNELLFGFPGRYYLNSNIEKLSPLTYISMIDEDASVGRSGHIRSDHDCFIYPVSVFL